MDPLPHQQRAFEELWRAIDAGARTIVVEAPTGAGKCLARGTLVMRYDGGIVPVENVRQGDLLMGPDSRPRRVLALGSGEDDLYRIVPTKGEPFTVNSDHILSVRLSDGDKHVEISVRDYLEQSRTFKHRAKCWRVGVEFVAPRDPLPIDPYFLGVWLGDGTSTRPEITTGDREIEAFIRGYAVGMGVSVTARPGTGCNSFSLTTARWRSSPVFEGLRDLDLFGNKHIPAAYKFNSRAARLQVLAGLIDTDGALSHNGYDLIFKVEQLARDVVFMARSLGYAAYIAKCQKTCTNNGKSGAYYRISISGECREIPVLLERKKAKQRQQKKNVLRTGFKVEPAGRGEYFGFTLDGDGLFLLGDFTVTHNTFMMSMNVREALRRAWPSMIITNRKLLTRQAGKEFGQWGISHGHVAAGFEYSLLKDVQVASFQTLHSRAIQRGVPEVLELMRRIRHVIVDEAHNNVNPTAKKVLEFLSDQGAVIVGMTATPVDLDQYYAVKIVAGNNTEMIKCGLHVPAVHFGPDEPDLKHVGKIKGGEYEEGGVVKAIMVPGVYARVINEWRRLNPEGLPTLLFAPSVETSRGFVEQFIASGHTAAHIDADTEDDERERIIEGSRTGEIQVVCNRFVMREGVNMPWLAHIIIATAFGTIKTYVQAGGRGKRATEGKRDVCIQDHGGNWWKYGSLNEDREWRLNDTSKDVQERYNKPREEGVEHQPICCPKCAFIRLVGPKCPKCGHEHAKSVRYVVQSDGELKKMMGPGLKIVRYEQKQQKTWTSCLFGAARANMTVRQAMAVYKKRMGHWPPFTLKPMLPSDGDLRNEYKVADVWPWLAKKKETLET